MTGWLIAAIVAPAAGGAIVRLTPGAARPLAGLAALAAAVPSAVLLIAAAGGERITATVEWLPAGGGIEAGLRLDPLSAAMTATVAAVGLVVVVYATGYFASSPREAPALAGLLGFLACMQGLVLADGFLTLLVFWELVGAMSARLIAWSRDDPLAPGGAVRAFLTTRSADLGLYLALLALFAATGSVAFAAERPEGALGAVVGAGLVIAAMGKSAQVPFQTWLTGAMAGPTPVSALLHSATMVAAGVYLLVRSQDLLAGWPLELAGWLGAGTAVLGAVIALGQRDLKRLLAGSTTSQLGFMFLGAAAGGPAVAIFLLVTHAAGKAGMFLAAGMFQHARGSTDLEALRGAGRSDPRAFAVFAVGAASVAAVPPLAAFWAKDSVLAASEHQAGWFVLGLVAAGGTAAYLLRPALILWRGPQRRPAIEDRWARRAMLGSGLALAVASIAGGALGPPLADLLAEGALPGSTLSAVLSLLAVAAGAGAVLVGLRPAPALRRAAAAQLYVNDALKAAVERPLLGFARLSDAVDRQLVDRAVDGGGRATLALSRSSDVVERSGIDAAVDGLARGVGRGGDRTSAVQSGRLHEYLRDTVAGLAAVGLLVALTAVL